MHASLVEYQLWWSCIPSAFHVLRSFSLGYVQDTYVDLPNDIGGLLIISVCHVLAIVIGSIVTIGQLASDLSKAFPIYTFWTVFEYSITMRVFE